MSFAQKIHKYSLALVQQFEKMLRLSTKFVVNTTAADSYLANVNSLSHVYFRDNNLLASHSIYKELPSNLRKAVCLFFNFFPLPSAIEAKLYGKSLVERHHHARLELVRSILPKASRILDLGGADAMQQCGALLSMGYPHAPAQLHIVDLPVAERLYDPSNIPETKNHWHGECEISYSYHSMKDLEHLCQKEPFDMIWMGQTIEHITPEELDKVLSQAGRLLKKGGLFCLDTPNRALTRLMDPNRYIHPDHKKEYCPDELINLFAKKGFILSDSLAINPLPLSLKTRILHRLEFLQGALLNSHPEVGYSFYLCFRKK